LIFLAVLVVPMVQELQLPQAHKVSRQFVVESEGLRAVLGEPMEWGPIPIFFWKETQGPQETWTGSFYFLVKGPRATTVVVVQLHKPGRSRGQWQIAEGSFYLDEEGNRMPVPHGGGPARPKPSRKN
jgi:hypothetical protein